MVSEPTVASDPKPDKGSQARSAARLAAVQALYQMDIAQTELENVISEFTAHRMGPDEDITPPDVDHFQDVVRGVVREQRMLDGKINDRLARGWALARVDATLRAILRAGTYELQRCEQIPLKVVITEYVDVAHAFFEGDEPGVVNAVLDKLGHEMRGDGDQHGADK